MYAYQEVTNGMKPYCQRMVSRNASEGCKPRNFIVAVGQGLVCLEASIVAVATWRDCNGMPGSQNLPHSTSSGQALSVVERAAAGHLTDRIGTWDSRIACMPQSALGGKKQGGVIEIRQSDRLIVEA